MVGGGKGVDDMETYPTRRLRGRATAENPVT